jgi:hypothetical protein
MISRASTCVLLASLAGCGDGLDRCALRITAVAGCDSDISSAEILEPGGEHRTVPFAIVIPGEPALLTIENLLDEAAIITSLSATVQCDVAFGGRGGSEDPSCGFPRVEPVNIPVGARTTTVVPFDILKPGEVPSFQTARLGLEVRGQSGDRAIGTPEALESFLTFCPKCCQR